MLSQSSVTKGVRQLTLGSSLESDWVQQGRSIFLHTAPIPVKPTMVENKGDITGVGATYHRSS